MDIEEQRQSILKDVATGRLSVEEANRQLASLESGGDPAGGRKVEYGEVIAPARADLPAAHWKKWWQIPFWISMALVVLGGYWMYTSYLANGMSWGFWFSFLLFLLALLGVIASALSRNSRWLHVRIRSQEDGKPHNIAFSFPIPFRAASQIVRNFSWAMPEEIREAHLDEVIQAVDDSITADQPIEVFVDDQDGEHVEIYIG